VFRPATLSFSRPHLMPAELPTVPIEVRVRYVVAIMNLGPWTGSKEGEVGHLRLALRSLLFDQGFEIVYAHVSKLDIENPIGAHGLDPANTECPNCKGTGRVDQHVALRWAWVGQGADWGVELTM
jgi:hypothetical protein